MSAHTFTIEKGTTDVSLFIRALDSTDGTILASLVYNSAGMACYYKRGATDAATALTLATQTTTGAHADGGFVEIDATNMDGAYRLDLSDAICATGVDRALIVIQGATNLQPIHINIDLVDPINVTSGVIESNLKNVNGTAQTAGDLAALITTVDTVVDAIKVITDQMVFTKANELDSNAKSINGAAVVGDGNATPWDGA